MRIEAVPITHPDAVRLIAQVQAEYVVRYGNPDQSPIDAEEFDPPAGRFFVGYVDGTAVATGAWRRSSIPALDAASTGEIKRMFVVPTHQRQGLGRAMLAHLEQTAAADGVEALVLETGTRQPEALALYASSGYEQVPGFGHYSGSPLSRCFARRLPEARSVAARWDAEAATFDDEPDHGLRDPVTREAWRDLLRDVLPEPPSRVADLGCGTGSLSVLLAEEGHTVTGLDVSPAMLDRARTKAADARVALELVEGDAADPPLVPAYDAVLCRHVLWALPEPVEVLRRWARLLAPGGTLVLVEGRWGTGAGLTSAETEELLARAGLDSEVRPLTDPALWGGAVDDERYLVRAHVVASSR